MKYPSTKSILNPHRLPCSRREFLTTSGLLAAAAVNGAKAQGSQGKSSRDTGRAIRTVETSVCKLRLDAASGDLIGI